MKIESTYLKTVNNYALNNRVSASYIYKMIRENKMTCIEIDGVKFIDISKFPTLPTKQ